MTPIKRKATEADAVMIASRLREQDRKEVEASSGPDVQRTVLDSLLNSDEAFVWTLNDEPICIAGIVKSDLPGSPGVPWMLGTPEMVSYGKMLVKDARIYLDEKLKQYPCLFNFVHQDNSISIAWLKRLGFQFGHTVPEYGHGKQPFILFYRYGNV